MASLASPLSCEVCDGAHSATRYCVECRQFMCDFVANFHLKMAVCQGHHIVSASDAELYAHTTHTEKCRDHPKKEYEYYDTQCGRLVCSSCVVLDHKGHDCQTIEEAAKGFRERVEAMVVRANNVNKRVRAAERRVGDVEAELARRKEEEAAKIKETFFEVRGGELVDILSDFF